MITTTFLFCILGHRLTQQTQIHGDWTKRKLQSNLTNSSCGVSDCQECNTTTCTKCSPNFILDKTLGSCLSLYLPFILKHEECTHGTYILLPINITQKELNNYISTCYIKTINDGRYYMFETTADKNCSCMATCIPYNESITLINFKCDKVNDRFQGVVNLTISPSDPRVSLQSQQTKDSFDDIVPSNSSSKETQQETTEEASTENMEETTEDQQNNQVEGIPTHLTSNSTSTAEQTSDISDMSINQDHRNVNKSIDNVPSLQSNQTNTASKTQSKSSISKQNKSDTNSQIINKSKDSRQNKSYFCKSPFSSSNNDLRCLDCLQGFILDGLTHKCLAVNQLKITKNKSCHEIQIELPLRAEQKELNLQMATSCSAFQNDKERKNLQIFQNNYDGNSYLSICIQALSPTKEDSLTLYCNFTKRFTGQINISITLPKSVKKISSSSQNLNKTVNQSTLSSNETSQISASPTQSPSDSHKLQNATISDIMEYMAQEDEKSSPTTAKIHKFMNNSYQELSNRSTIVGQVSYAMRYVPFWSKLTNYPYWLCYFQLMKLHTMYHVEATENLISMWVFKGAKNKMVQNILPIDANYIYNNLDIDPVYNQLGLTPIFVYSNSNVILIITLLLIFKSMPLIQKTDFDPSGQQNQYLLIQELTDQQKMLISNLYEQGVSRIRLLRDRLVYSTLDQAYLCSMISLLLMLKQPGYDGAFEIISNMIAICYLFFFIGVNGKAYYRIRQIISIINHFKFTNHQAYDILVMKTRSVFRYQLMDLDLSSNANYYYHLLTYFKKTIMVLAVFYMNDEYGMVILSLLQVVILYALFVMRPYKKKSINITFLFVILLKLFLSLDISTYIREPSKSPLNDCRSLGWVVVCMELIGLGLTIFYNLIGMCETLHRASYVKQTQTHQPTRQQV